MRTVTVRQIWCAKRSCGGPNDLFLVQSAKVPIANRHFPSFAPQGGGLQKKMDEALDPRSIDRAGIYLDLTNKTQHLRQVFSPETKYGKLYCSGQS